jgi:hypothetical protein
MAVRLLPVRSASTTPSSSSPASPSVRRSRSSQLRGPTIRATTSTVWSAAVSTITGVNQFTYTAQFGNGVSLSLSAQDQTAYYAGRRQQSRRYSGARCSARSAYGAGDYAGTIAPDLIASLRVDQAWGLFQASFAAHNNHAAYYGGTELTGHPDDKWGWAGALALSIKNIPTGPGDTINIQGVYTNGATRYNIQDLAGSAGANTIFGGTNLPGAYQSIGFGIAPDSVFVNGGQQQLITTYGLRGAYTHNWNPYWNTSDLRCVRPG